MLRRKGIPVIMVSPLESVTTSLDINTTQEWRLVNKNPPVSNIILNQKYLKGEIISTDFINTSILDEPAIRDPRKISPFNYIRY